MAIKVGGPTGLSDERPTVMFGNRSALERPIPENTVLIVPSEDSWNDFGYRTRIVGRIRLPGESQEHTFGGFIGFVPDVSDNSNGLLRLAKILDGVDQLTVVATDQHRYFTMLPSMNAYREIVQKLGVDYAATVLTAMNDIVALFEFSPSVNWLDLAVQSDVFVKSFIRFSEGFFAFKNAGSLLRGAEYEEFRALPKSIGIRFQLPGRENEHDLSFNFDHEADLPKRIAVVIGKNGVGKSQTLGRIVRSALEQDGSLSDGETGERLAFNRILAFAPTNEAGTVFPSDRRKRPRIWYRRFSLNRSNNVRKGRGASDLVIQVARSDEYIGETSRWEIFLNALKVIDNWEQICLPRLNDKSAYISLTRLNKGSEQIILETFAAVDTGKEPVRVIDRAGYPLSSGEISFLKFAAQASLHIENGSLLLLDEPETHLHPNFISQFVALLDMLLVQTGSVAILATHSVYFVREVFREQVTVLRAGEDGFINVERPTLRTFGADVGAISYFVFGEDEPSHLAAEVEARLLMSGESWESLYEKYKDELSLELLNSLRASIDERAQA